MEFFYAYKERCFNSLAVATVHFLYIILPFITFIVTFIAMFTRFFPLVILYFIWILYDWRSCIDGRRRSNWWRSSWFFRRFPSYFPQEIIKTAELPPTENYILCLFPHGCYATAGMSHFAGLTGSFYRLFPGLETSIHTVNSNLCLPISREINLSTGLVSVSEECLRYHLDKPGGHAVLLAPGGVVEGLLSQPESYKVVLKNRKGFVKMALKTGANLVPMYSFGENDLYDQYIISEGHPLYGLQQFLLRIFKVGGLPIVKGVGFFQDYFGLLPRRKPVFTVVGRPIKVPKLETIDPQELDHWHAKFTEELVDLFDRHKSKYVPNPGKVFLEIV